MKRPSLPGRVPLRESYTQRQRDIIEYHEDIPAWKYQFDSRFLSSGRAKCTLPGRVPRDQPREVVSDEELTPPPPPLPASDDDFFMKLSAFTLNDDREASASSPGTETPTSSSFACALQDTMSGSFSASTLQALHEVSTDGTSNASSSSGDSRDSGITVLCSEKSNRKCQSDLSMEPAVRKSRFTLFLNDSSGGTKYSLPGRVPREQHREVLSDEELTPPPPPLPASDHKDDGSDMHTLLPSEASLLAHCPADASHFSEHERLEHPLHQPTGTNHLCANVSSTSSSTPPFEGLVSKDATNALHTSTSFSAPSSTNSCTNPSNCKQKYSLDSIPFSGRARYTLPGRVPREQHREVLSDEELTPPPPLPASDHSWTEPLPLNECVGMWTLQELHEFDNTSISYEQASSFHKDDGSDMHTLFPSEASLLAHCPADASHFSEHERLEHPLHQPTGTKHLCANVSSTSSSTPPFEGLVSKDATNALHTSTSFSAPSSTNSCTNPSNCNQKYSLDSNPFSGRTRYTLPGRVPLEQHREVLSDEELTPPPLPPASDTQQDHSYTLSQNDGSASLNSHDETQTLASSSSPLNCALQEVARAAMQVSTRLDDSYVASPDDQVITVNGCKYHMLQELGRGGFSVVYSARSKSLSDCAIKCIHLHQADHSTVQAYLNEVRILQKLRGSRHVIYLYDDYYDIASNRMYMVMERGEEDLKSFFNRNSSADPRCQLQLITKCWREMLEAVLVIHDNDIVHWDLKPANFVVAGGILKVIDFGISKQVLPDHTSATCDQIMGTYNFMSPEAFTNIDTSLSSNDVVVKAHKKSDVWSLGMILYSMVYGDVPFRKFTDPLKKILAIRSPQYQIPFPPSPLGDHIVQTVKKCLERSCNLRPTVKELLNCL